jgi:hypothetical protein
MNPSDDFKKSGRLRHRFLAVVIIFSLSVIFIPMFFEYVPNDIYLPTIPEAPQAPAIEVLTPADFSDPISTITASSAAPQAWSLKIHETTIEAERLVKQLKQAGYPAYTIGPKESLQVLVGPETNQKTIDEWMIALQKKNFQTEIVTYNPTETYL